MLTDESYITARRGRGGGEPERKRGREGGRERREIFFHCMPAAALISWSILVNSFREETADCVIKRGKEVESCVFQYLTGQQFLLNHRLSGFPHLPSQVVQMRFCKSV